jgi:hypothetical protein
MFIHVQLQKAIFFEIHVTFETFDGLRITYLIYCKAYVALPREYWMIYRGPGFLVVV